MKAKRICRFLVILILSTPLAGEEHQHQAMESLGRVNFPISCAPAVQSTFTRGVALLYSFEYEQAQQAFQNVAQKDPACAMAYWGEAMTDFHQYLASVSQDDVTRAQAEIAKADAAKETTPRETASVATTEVSTAVAPPCAAYDFSHAKAVVGSFSSQSRACE